MAAYRGYTSTATCTDLDAKDGGQFKVFGKTKTGGYFTYYCSDFRDKNKWCKYLGK